jgi:hypothetical protein
MTRTVSNNHRARERKTQEDACLRVFRAYLDAKEDRDLGKRGAKGEAAQERFDVAWKAWVTFCDSN